MRAKYKLTNPRDAEATLEVTMSVNDWAKLRQQLLSSTESTSYPAWRLRDLIGELITKAENEFEAEEEFER